LIVRNANEQALAFVYCDDEPGRRTTAKLLTRDEARRIAANIAKRTPSPWLCVDECAAMVRRGYVQSYVSTRQRGEPILPPVMSAVKCQKLAAKGNHRGVGPNAAKATWEPDHAIIGARGD
jgi:hypothetical protein